jgi:diguanylate cyclase (GGDEF)-like protein
MKLAERIRTAIAGLRVPVGNDELQVTVSLGVAERTEDAGSLQDMLRLADMALYDAKANGRNRAEAADQPARPHGWGRPASR